MKKIEFLNNVYSRLRGTFRDKFIMVRTMIDNPDWFTQYCKYIEPDFFKGNQGESDVLADIVNTMRNIGKDNISIPSLRDYMLNNMRKYAGLFEEEFTDGFDMIEFVKPDESYLKFILRKMLGLTVLKKMVSNPEVFEMNGINTGRKEDVDKLLLNDTRMFEILERFDSEKELVSDIRTFLQLKAGTGYDFNLSEFEN